VEEEKSTSAKGALCIALSGGIAAKISKKGSCSSVHGAKSGPGRGAERCQQCLRCPLAKHENRGVYPN